MNASPYIFHFRELSDLDAVATGLIDIGRDSSVWLFNGHMGAGKTTLIKAICRQLGVQSVVQSPTFALVNEYISDTSEVIYHFDFYRIRQETEALDMGIEEYFDSGNFCFVEWPDQIGSLWPQNYMHLDLSLQEDGQRILKVTEINAGKVIS